jgi:hypothetical protein
MNYINTSTLLISTIKNAGEVTAVKKFSTNGLSIQRFEKKGAGEHPNKGRSQINPQ